MTMTPRIARRNGYKTQNGVLVYEVTPYSVAARNGLQRGDIILEANRKEVTEADELEKIIDKLNSGDTLMLRIRREGQSEMTESIVTLRIPE